MQLKFKCLYTLLIVVTSIALLSLPSPLSSVAYAEKPKGQKTPKRPKTKSESPSTKPQARPTPSSEAPSPKIQQEKISEKKSPVPSGFDTDMGKLPTYIKSDSLTVKNKERVFVYDGNVEVTHGDMILTSKSLEGNYDEKNQIKDLVARENVTIIKGEDMRATGEQAVYDKASNTLVLTDNPELQQNGSILTADKIRIFLEDNRSVAEGQVRVKLVKKAEDESGTGNSGTKAPPSERKPFGLDSLRE